MHTHTYAMTPAETTRTLSTADERRETLIRVAVPIFAEQGFRARFDRPDRRGRRDLAGLSVPPLPDEDGSVRRRLRRGPQPDHRDPRQGRRRRRRSRRRDDPSTRWVTPTARCSRPRGTCSRSSCRRRSSPASPGSPRPPQRTFNDLYALASERSGATDEELRDWFATGMLMNVMAAIGAPELTSAVGGALCA